MRKPLSFTLAVLALLTQFWYFIIKLALKGVVLIILIGFLYAVATFVAPLFVG